MVALEKAFDGPPEKTQEECPNNYFTRRSTTVSFISFRRQHPSWKFTFGPVRPQQCIKEVSA